MTDGEQARKLGQRYEVREVIRGREHIVYHAVDSGRFQREVALVAPSAAVTANPEWLARFVDDSRKLGELQSPHLVTVHDFVEEGRWDNDCYLIREWSDTTLDAVIGDPIQPYAAAAILRQVLLGLQVLHQAGIAHGTLTPSSIFLSHDFESVKLGDLGLAAPIGGDPHISDLRLALDYMAPELFDSTIPVAPAVDLYSLGHIAYRLLLGQQRFEAEFAAIYNSQVEEVRSERWSAWHRNIDVEARPLHEVDPELPQPLSDLISRMMAKEPSLRYADAPSALAELDQACQQLGMVAAGGQPDVVDSGAEVELDLGGGDNALTRFLRSKTGIAAAIGSGLLILMLILVTGGDDSQVTDEQMGEAIEALKSAKAAAIAAAADQPPALPNWTLASEHRQRALDHQAAEEWDQTHAALLAATEHYIKAKTDAEARSAARQRIPPATMALEQARQLAIEAGADQHQPERFGYSEASALASNSLGEAERAAELSMADVDRVVTDLERAATLYSTAAEQVEEHLRLLGVAKQQRQAAFAQTAVLRDEVLEQGAAQDSSAAFNEAEEQWQQAQTLAEAADILATQDELLAQLLAAHRNYQLAGEALLNSKVAAEVTAKLDAVIALREELVEQGIKQHPRISAFAMGERLLTQVRGNLEKAELADSGERALMVNLIDNTADAYQVAASQLRGALAREQYHAAKQATATARRHAIDSGAAGRSDVSAFTEAETQWQAGTAIDPAAADHTELQAAGEQLAAAQAAYAAAMQQLSRATELAALDAALEQALAARERGIEAGADRHPGVTAFGPAEALLRQAIEASREPPQGDALQQLLDQAARSADGFQLALAQLADAEALAQMQLAQQLASEARRAALAAGVGDSSAFINADSAREQATWQVATARERAQYLQVAALLEQATAGYQQALQQVANAERDRRNLASALQPARSRAAQAKQAAIEAGAQQQAAFADGDEQLEQADKLSGQTPVPTDPAPIIAVLEQATAHYTLAIEQLAAGNVVGQDAAALQALFGERVMEFVDLDKGCFHMGSRDSGGRRAEHSRPDRDERYHRVCLDAPVAIATHEVTQGQYRIFASATGRDQTLDQQCQSDDCPAAYIGWHDALAYATWLSAQADQTYRLPTEAEWAFAVREGQDNSSLRHWGEQPDGACQYANVSDQSAAAAGAAPGQRQVHRCNDGHTSTAPVGSYAANALGLYDLFGNVWEWTCSAYSRDYDGSELRCASPGASKVSIRGGSWQSEPRRIRAADRFWGHPDDRFQDLGFRLVREAVPQ